MMQTGPRYHPDRVVLPLIGPLTREDSARMRAEVDLAVGYYGYRDVELVVESPGGELTALQSLLDDLTGLRTQIGLKIRTQALGDVASAAAFLLALGCPGHRVMAPSARLLLHEPRVSIEGSSPRRWTRSDLVEAGTLLRDANERLLVTLVNHVWSSTITLESPMRRAEGRVVAEARSEDELKQIYADLLREERWLSPREAVSLGLADRVSGSELIPDRVHLTARGGL